MKQVTQNYKTGELKIEEVPLPFIKENGILVKNHYSVISAGTERATLEISKRGYLGKAKEKPEQLKQVIRSAKTLGLRKTYGLVMNKLNTPVPLGYSTSGTVIEVGKNAYEFQPGDRVACAGGGYASHAEVVFIPKNLCAKIPKGVKYEEAAYTTLGAIALQGIRLAETSLGERVAVIGLGLIGLLTVQLLKAAGCIVIGLDIDNYAINNALKCGAEYILQLGKDDVDSFIQSITQGEGVDAVIITAATKSNKPIELAGLISRKKGRVVVVGDVGLTLPRQVYYEKELKFSISCSYGPGRYDPNYEEYGIDYPFGYVRWTEKRNMEAFLQIIKEKKVDLDKITTHKFRIGDAEKAFRLIMEKKKEKFIGILLEYDYQKELDPKVKVKRIESRKISKINIGFVGAGNFAQLKILPALKKHKKISLEGVVAAESHLAKAVAEKFGFNKCYSDAESIFIDENVNTIIITTRHNLHAQYVIEGLKNNKNIYVEKPLAMNEVELKDILKVWSQSKEEVFVGFNRRFAPFIEKTKMFFKNRNSPMFINYRINAGFISPDHWIQSQDEGGGRVIGEVCHFVDLCQFLIQSNYKSIFAQNLGDDRLRDNLVITIKFDDGSVANIIYLANGDINYPKERIEIFCQNSIAVIDDFRRLELVRGGNCKIHKGSQDKGHQRQIDIWLESIESDSPSPVPFVESVNSTIATFMIHESLNKGKNIHFNDFSQRFYK